MRKGLSLVILISLITIAVSFQSCKKATEPSLTTEAVTDITLNSAVSGGTITSDGGEEVLEKGVCWSTTQNPTVADSKTTNGTGSGDFTSNLVGLNAGTPYFVRAYATNSVGTGYGNEVTFTTNQVTGAVVTTTEVASVTSTSAVSGGNVTDAGGSAITARGVCWSTSQNPTIADNKTTNGTTTGVYESTLTGLTDGVTYFYRAYATNSTGTTYGQQFQFITPVTDIEGNIYKTVAIGTQVWMAENLKTTKYNDDAVIPNVTLNADWIALTTDAYCWAQNSETTYKDLYGALYNWYAVETDKLCPTGWHVPTDAEFITLEVSLGMTQVDATGTGLRGVDEGKEMKSTTGWSTGQTGTNTSGFTALPAGYRSHSTGISEGIGLNTYWWTSTATSTDISVYRRIDGDSDKIARDGTYNKAGKSIRCVKD